MIKRKSALIAGILITTLFLASCVRPTTRVENPNIGDGDVALPTVAPTTAPVEGGDETTGDTTEPVEPTAVPVEEPGDDSTPDNGEAPDGDSDGATGGDSDTSGDTDGNNDGGSTDDTDNGSDESTGDNNGNTGSTDDGNSGQDDSQTTPPSEHIVKAGENLYRIGLLYGISFLQIAEANNISAPYTISVGQTLQIPSSEPNSDSETTYVVKAGDTLFSIGVAQGVSWVQIAEANGLNDPNRISAGDTLKIPVSTPGPTPQFSHTVKTNETLYSIAVQYGVSWTAVAAENNISSPYIIFPGSVLKIPGN